MNRTEILNNIFKKQETPLLNAQVTEVLGDGYYLVSEHGNRARRVLSTGTYSKGDYVLVSTAENRIVGSGRRMGTPKTITL